MSERQIGAGALVKCDFSGTASFVTVSQMPSFTPAGRERVRVDQTCLDDTLEIDALGIEAKSDITFDQFYDLNDADHAKIDALFDSKAARNWQEIYPFTSPVTLTYSAKVVGLSKASVEPSGMLRRTVTIHRVGSITKS